MCWATPGRIVGLVDDSIVKVDFGGIEREAIVGFEGIQVGDLVMVHSGVVLGKITTSELVSNLGLFMEAEKIGLQDLGYTPSDAEAMEKEEFRILLASFGLKP